jgi:MFS transporter, AAHS family, 4-hydroxybenzoate transporter
VNDRPASLTINAIIDQRPLGRFQVQIAVLCGIVLVLDGFDAQCIGFLAPPISGTLHIPLPAFGGVFAAGLTGLMIGAMAIGPIADRCGRKWTIILSTLAFALFSLLTARIESLDELVALRFLTGLGLGGAMPNAIALTSEYAPKHLQRVLVSALTAGMPLGAIVASLASRKMIPLWGWPSVFYLGGFLPLVIAAISALALPESIRFLTVRRANSSRIRPILLRIAPDLAGSAFNLAPAAESSNSGMPVTELFTEGRALGTFLLWIPFFMNLLILYFVVSWLPGLLHEAGMPNSTGVMAVFFFSLGGMLGALIEGQLMNGLGASIVLVAEFSVSVALIYGLAYSASSYVLLMAVILVLGFTVQGGQAGINALAADYYPTRMRSTGVGWALGIGRIGSIIGPALGGFLLSLQWTPRQILLAGIVPALITTLAVLFGSRLYAEPASYRSEAEAGGAS